MMPVYICVCECMWWATPGRFCTWHIVSNFNLEPVNWNRYVVEPLFIHYIKCFILTRSVKGCNKGVVFMMFFQGRLPLELPPFFSVLQIETIILHLHHFFLIMSIWFIVSSPFCLWCTTVLLMTMEPNEICVIIFK